MMNREREIRKRLEEAHRPPRPPAELLDTLKNQIPERFAYREAPRSSWMRSAVGWRVAASLVAVIGAAYVALRFGSPGPIEEKAPSFPRQTVAVQAPPPQTAVPGEVGGANEGQRENTAVAPQRRIATPAPEAGATLRQPASKKTEESKEDLRLADAPMAAQEPAAPPPPPSAIASSESASSDRLDRAQSGQPQKAAAADSAATRVEGGVEGGVIAAAPSVAMQKAASPPVRIRPGLRTPRLIACEGVSYPEEARKAGVRGTVRLEATIDESGKVTAVRLLEGLPMGLSDAASNAVLHSRFEAPRLDGRPVTVIREVRVRFSPESGACVDCDE